VSVDNADDVLRCHDSGDKRSIDKTEGEDFMRRDHVLMLVAALMLPAAVAYAKPMTFTTTLTQALEVPPTGSPATGSATVVLDPTAQTLGVQVTFSGLTSNTIMAHIHCCLASLFVPGVNVGVATTVPAFPGFPLGVTSGTYNHVLDLTSAASYNPAFVTLQGGTIAGAEAALIKGIESGETYLNIHTTNFPGGEIRGFLAASPTPAQLSLLTTIPIDGTAGNRATKLFSFDISWVDRATGLYYLADRSNAALDVIDTTGAFTGTPDTLFGQIGGPAFNFAGDTGSSATSGPNGVTAASPCIFATDGPSRVVSINSSISFVTPVSSVSTGGTKRADELAFDPKDSVLLVINNADTPPFGTLVSVSSTCALTVGTRIAFSTINATNGAEQPVWEPLTQRFYVSIPEINGPGDGTGPNGGVARINPTSGAIETVYPVNFMQPAGLTLGPNGDLLVGSNSVFDTSGKKCTAVVPSPNPSGTAAGAPATCTGIGYPQVAVCNPPRGCTGNALESVPGVGGGDEVWYNSGDGNYYVTAGNDPVGPVFGVVGSVVNMLSQLVPTLPPVPATNPPTPPGHSAGTVHSITASAVNNHVYVALPANTSYPDCAQGCIAVFSAQ
jgi:CHRD domain